MNIEGYEFPEDLYYSKDHYWVKPEGYLLVMGITDNHQGLAGEFNYIDLPDEGQKITKDKPFTSIESGKWVGRVFAPVNGVIVEINEELDDDATLMNKSPYGDGWICKIKPDNMDDIKELMQPGDGKFDAFMKEEILKYKKED
ncbi:MAG: glycine cleavage system protein H [Promethearchaeota archaeon]